MPPLVGRRVVLRATRSSDITPQHVAWLNDPQVVQFSNQRFVQHTLDRCLRYHSAFKGSINVYASVRLLGSDEAIGTLTAYRNVQHGTADIGILIGDCNCWGLGLGLEAFTLLASWLSTLPGMRKLTCGMLACNHGMLALALRAGFAREAVRVGQELVQGQAVDLVYFARFCPTVCAAPAPADAARP